MTSKGSDSGLSLAGLPPSRKPYNNTHNLCYCGCNTSFPTQRLAQRQAEQQEQAASSRKSAVPLTEAEGENGAD